MRSAFDIRKIITNESNKEHSFSTHMKLNAADAVSVCVQWAINFFVVFLFQIY